jgi:hypothetical protein
LGVAYNSTVIASGGTGIYRFAIVGGALPGGLALNPTTGTISGTPSVDGTFSYTVQAADSAGATATTGSTPCPMQPPGARPPPPPPPPPHGTPPPPSPIPNLRPKPPRQASRRSSRNRRSTPHNWLSRAIKPSPRPRRDSPKTITPTFSAPRIRSPFWSTVAPSSAART